MFIPLSWFQARASRQPMAFLEHLRPGLPWCLVSGGRATTFLPQEYGAAATWIAKAQRRGRNVSAVLPNTGLVVGMPLVRGMLRKTRHFAIKTTVEGAADYEHPSPFARIDAGRNVYLCWRLSDPVPVEIVENLNGSHTIPLPGIKMTDGSYTQLVFMRKSAVYRPTDFSEAGTSELTRCADKITPEQQEWLWPGIFPAETLSLLGGAPGMGKSQIAITIAAAVLSGGSLPGMPAPLAPSNVLLFETEDTGSTTIVPRLMAAGADLSRVTIGENVVSIAQVIREAKRIDAALIVLSPIRRFLGEAQKYGNQAMRAALEPLMKYGRTTLGIAHPTKADAQKPAFAGDSALLEVVRAAWAAIPDPDDNNPIIRQRNRVLVSAKSNLSDDTAMVRYRIEGATVNGVATSRIVWVESGERNERSRINVPKPARVKHSARKLPPAAAWLARALANGPREAVELKSEAVKAGISTGSLYRARDHLGVKIQTVSAGNNNSKVWEL